MKTRVKITILLMLCTLVFCLLCGCEADVANASSEVNSNYQLEKYDSDYKKILESGTREFMGTHPIDESFLNWFVTSYGDKALNSIVEKGVYDNSDIWYEVTGKSIHVLWYEYCLYSGINAYENSFTHEIDTLSEDEIVFNIAGDVSLAEDKSTTNYMLEQKNGLMDCFDDNLLDVFNQSDVFVVNNEFAFTDGGDPIVEKYYTFRGPGEYVNELKHIGVGLVTIANNHIYDYREDGFLDTLRNLEKNEMAYIGAGRNLEDAKRPVYYIANGKKIAIVNATQIEKNQDFTKAATEDEAGVLKCLDPTEFIDEINYAKSNADYVIAIVHWGTEYQSRYGSDQKKLAEQFAEAGADVIVGGHPHVLQGFDYIGEVPVYYSLGNFYFSLDEHMPVDFDTGLAQITIKNDGTVKAGFIPCHFSECVISLVDDSDEMQKIFTELNNVSNNAMLNKKGEIIKK
ncbi:MAG: CapA family protein [Lachnospiraceae bacterium]|nr:CapA family protein [Lachnospiraceae bacterium]